MKSISNTDGEARPKTEIAVIGAGLSGLICARTLVDLGHRVRVFDKGRGPGGRMSTRRAGRLRFDHGAQYFTVRDPRFREQVTLWAGDGIVAPWRAVIAVLRDGEIEPTADHVERWVGVPGMDAVCRRLSTDLDVASGTRVVHLERSAGRWHLECDGHDDLGRFDAVVVSAPAPQTAALLATAAPGLAARAATVEMAPCWAAMVVFDEPLAAGFDGAFVHASPVSWVARNDAKPGRPGSESWVLHGSPEWSREHLDLDAEIAAHRLVDAFAAAIGRDLPRAEHLLAHRWRFALPVEPLAENCLFDSDQAIAACGDWAGGPRVEGAFLSGLAAAETLRGLTPTPSHGPTTSRRRAR